MGAVQRALAGVGNNATAPATVRQGRRAGQPTAMVPASDASFAFDLPNSQYGRGPEAWGANNAHAGEAGGKAPLAAPPLLPAPLNERLAKLKLKMGRKSEGAVGLPVGGNPGVPPLSSGAGRNGGYQPHPPSSSRPSVAASSRPISATSAASGDDSNGGASGGMSYHPSQPAGAGRPPRGGAGVSSAASGGGSAGMTNNGGGAAAAPGLRNGSSSVSGAAGGEDSLDREIKRQSSLGGAQRQPSPQLPRMSSAGA